LLACTANRAGRRVKASSYSQDAYATATTLLAASGRADQRRNNARTRRTGSTLLGWSSIAHGFAFLDCRPPAAAAQGNLLRAAADSEITAGDHGSAHESRHRITEAGPMGRPRCGERAKCEPVVRSDRPA
jgi:hypothetical protein